MEQYKSHIMEHIDVSMLQKPLTCIPQYERIDNWHGTSGEETEWETTIMSRTTNEFWKWHDAILEVAAINII